MRMDLQEFADPNDDNKQNGQPNESQNNDDNQQSNDNKQDSQNTDTGKSDDAKYMLNVAKKMNNFVEKMKDNQSQSSHNDKDKQQSASNDNQKQEKPTTGQDNKDAQIADLQKKYNSLVQAQNSNDLTKYTQKKINDAGLKVDNDTFNHLKGDTHDAIDNNIKWFSNYRKSLLGNSKGAPKGFQNNNNDDKKKQDIKAPKPKSLDKGIGKFFR